MGFILYKSRLANIFSNANRVIYLDPLQIRKIIAPKFGYDRKKLYSR
jgi:hypothetical protein